MSWGMVTHIEVSVKWVIIGSGNGLVLKKRQAITWTNADLLPIGSFGANLREILENVIYKLSSILCRSQSVKSLSYQEADLGSWGELEWWTSWQGQYC